MPDPSILRINDLPLRELCASSHIREEEYFRFMEHHGLDVSVVKEVDRHFTDERGMRLANALVRLPCHLPDIGINAGKDYNLDNEIQQACRAENLTLENGDLAFIHSTLAKRDAAIRKFAGKHDGKLTEITCNKEASLRMTCAFAGGGTTSPVTLKGTPAFWYEARTGRGNYHTLVLDFTNNYAPETEDGRPHAGIRGLAVLAASEHSKTRSVVVAQLVSGEVEPDEIKSHYFGDREIDSAEASIGAIVSRVAADTFNYLAGADAEGTPGESVSGQLDAGAKFGAHCVGCPGSACCGCAREIIEAYGEKLPDMDATMANMRTHLKLTKAKNLPMNIQTLQKTLAVTRTLLDKLALPEKLWKEAADVARELELKRAGTVGGWTLKPGANRVVLADKAATPANVYEALKPAIRGVSYEEFVRRTCEVRPVAVEALVGDVHKVAPEQALDGVLEPLLGAKNPLRRKANAPSVVMAGQPEAQKAEERPKAAALPVKASPSAGAKGAKIA